MISFLISTYNYDCTRLIHDIDKQCRMLKQKLSEDGFDYEIIVGDDASTDFRKEQCNRQACESLHCRYLSKLSNQGQACMRNSLAREAHYPYLVFMDSDAAVCTPDFVEQYWMHRDDAFVVVGGIRNPDSMPSEGCELRYRYEAAALSKRTMEVRMHHPYSWFTAFNILMHRSVFTQLSFDENCRQYGYEDALFGLELEKLGISIAHIDNPLVHMGIDSNQSFLHKTETALQTLLSMGESMHRHAGPSCLTQRFERMHMAGALARIFLWLRSPMRKNLLSAHPSLFLFNVYKLGYYCALRKGLLE